MFMRFDAPPTSLGPDTPISLRSTEPASTTRMPLKVWSSANLRFEMAPLAGVRAGTGKPHQHLQIFETGFQAQGDLTSGPGKGCAGAWELWHCLEVETCRLH